MLLHGSLIRAVPAQAACQLMSESREERRMVPEPESREGARTDVRLLSVHNFALYTTTLTSDLLIKPSYKALYCLKIMSSKHNCNLDSSEFDF